jgi:hypothetical protein
VALLEFLEASALSQWLVVSMAGGPTLLALHSVGMAVVVGLSLVVTLRLYRVLPGLRAELMPRLLALAAWGFALSVVTGLGFFITRGPDYVASGVFLAKMALVVVGAGLTAWLWRLLRPLARTPDVPAIDDAAKSVSLAATLTWLGAVVAGRMIAYLSDLY